jgi:Zn-dependent protease with chaperone function
MDSLLLGSQLLLIGGLILAILLSILSWWISRRKKTIDQFESDARIVLTFIIIISFYLLFLCVSVTYAVVFTTTHNPEHLMISLYLLFPPFLGILLYVLLPWVYGRHLHLKKCLPSDKVEEIAHLLNLPVPTLMTTPLEVPPLVYGRSGNHAIFVLPENMESLLTEEEQKAVITHELSHIKQGDVGFFTWLSLLTRGFTYWVLPFPVILLSGFGDFYFFVTNTGFLIFFFVPFFIVILIFLRNSLSRTRESIADAYVVFHGFGTPLKSALYKYAAKRASQPENVRKLTTYLNLYRTSRYLRPLLSTPPNSQAIP